MIVSAGRCQISPHMFPQHAAQLSTLQLCLSLLPSLSLPAFTKHSQTFFLLPPPFFLIFFFFMAEVVDLFFTFPLVHLLDQTTLTYELRLNYCFLEALKKIKKIYPCKSRLLFSVPTLAKGKKEKKEILPLTPQYERGQTLAISAEPLQGRASHITKWEGSSKKLAQFSQGNGRRRRRCSKREQKR